MAADRHRPHRQVGFTTEGFADLRVIRIAAPQRPGVHQDALDVVLVEQLVDAAGGLRIVVEAGVAQLDGKAEAGRQPGDEEREGYQADEGR